MKKAAIALAVLLLVLVGAGVYAIDWPWSKAKEIRPTVPGAQTIINRQREELKNLLIDAHSRNIGLKNAFANSNWQNFPLRDYAISTSATGRLRSAVERNIDGLFTTYKSLLRNYAADLDRVLTKGDGTPYAAGDFMKMMWTGTRGTPCEDDLSISREDIVSEILAGTCGSPQAKWIVYEKDNILAQVADLAEAARLDDTTDTIDDGWARTHRGDDWVTHQQSASASFDAYANVFKKAYEAPGMFGSPIPPKLEAYHPALEPMRPE